MTFQRYQYFEILFNGDISRTKFISLNVLVTEAFDATGNYLKRAAPQKTHECIAHTDTFLEAIYEREEATNKGAWFRKMGPGGWAHVFYFSLLCLDSVLMGTRNLYKKAMNASKRSSLCYRYF